MLQGPESFFEDASQYNDQLTFDDMNLSRPILKVRHSVNNTLLVRVGVSIKSYQGHPKAVQLVGAQLSVPPCVSAGHHSCGL